MKKRVMVIAMALSLGLSIFSQAKAPIYKWVKDKRVSSDDVLTQAQSFRVVSTSESQAEKLAREVMTENLYLSLAQYHTTRHQQDAETTSDSALPEEIIHQQEVDLIDEDYRFILEVKTKRFGNRTRVTAKAWPVYRLRDTDAEEARDEGTTTENSVEVKIKSDQPSAINLGPIIVAPIVGLPGDYGLAPLPDAGQRAALIVKSFMYFLDMRLKDVQQPAAEPVAAPKSEPAAESAKTETAPADAPKASAVEVDVKVKQKK